MELVLSQFLNTIFLRPYVFVFFLVYFLGCAMHLGVKRAVLFGIAGYIIAWLSEYSSIHNGFPYGYYYYIEHTKGKEIWVMGVPLMDSVSYVFLAYASYSMALMVISPVIYSKGIIYILETKRIRNSLYARILGAVFFVYLDIIIDPVALQGNRWFLGQIYGYPEKGVYFGVPISNFIGWFVVGYVLIYVLQKIDRLLLRMDAKDFFGYGYTWRYMIGPLLYAGIVVFNIAITFYIREYTIGFVGIFITFLPLLLIISIIKIKRFSVNVQKSRTYHLEDFPQAIVPQ